MKKSYKAMEKKFLSDSAYFIGCEPFAGFKLKKYIPATNIHTHISTHVSMFDNRFIRFIYIYKEGANKWNSEHERNYSSILTLLKRCCCRHCCRRIFTAQFDCILLCTYSFTSIKHAVYLFHSIAHCIPLFYCNTHADKVLNCLWMYKR